MRLWETDNRVHVFWRGDAEFELDLLRGLPIFESYRVWRSDGWERPLGSSVETGPPSTSWVIMAEYDVVDVFEYTVGTITGFRRPSAVRSTSQNPRCSTASSPCPTA